MEANAAYIEEREISAIDDLLQSLYERGLITDIECRIIVCNRQLSEKQLVIYKIILSKSKQTAAQLIKVFRAMTCGLHAGEKLKLQDSDYKHATNEFDSPLEANKNPMLNDTVIKCIFGFLPLDDIKNCRVVSRQWNSTAEILLRKRAKIHFSTDGLRTKTFLAVSKYSFPDLPFSAFKFSESENTELYWREAELEDFFEKWGKNIKELKLDNINIKCANDSSTLLSKYDVTPLLKNASHISSLEIDCSEYHRDIEEGEKELNISLSLGKLKPFSEIKTFIMKGNSMDIYFEKGTIIRMVPVNIELSNVTCKRNNEILQQFRYNDFFDFSQAVTIRLDNCKKNVSKVTLDLTNHVFKNTNELYLDAITIKNWGSAKGNVQNVELRNILFTEKSHDQLKIQSFQISCSVFDLFALPRTVERIDVYNCNISCSEPLSLPNLKFLKLRLCGDNSYQLTRFRLENCQNLKQLVISCYINQETNLTRMFNIKNLKINLPVLKLNGRLTKYLADESVVEIPGLVVLDGEYVSDFSDYARIAKRFRTRTLVLVYYELMNVSTAEIVECVLENMQKQPKRIIIGTKYDYMDLHSQTPFEGSLISEIVDAKSNYYEFNNSYGIFGKAITREEFLNGCVSVGNESIPFF